MNTRTDPPYTVAAALHRAASMVPGIIDRDQTGRMPSSHGIRTTILHAVRTACPGVDVRVVNEITDACGDALVSYLAAVGTLTDNSAKLNTWARLGVGIAGMGMTHVIRLLDDCADLQDLPEAA